MEGIRIAVCDDEKVSLKTVCRFVEKCFTQYGIDFSINAFESVGTMWESVQKKGYDLCFLDIDMPEMDGITFAEQICRKNSQTLIVFVSAKEEYVFQSFRIHPFSFVRKACFQQDMEQTIKDILKLRREQKAQEMSCLITDEAGYEYSFLVDSLWYLEAREKYVNIVLTESEKLLRCSMKSLEKELEQYGLIRCHKSYIVNIKKVYAVKYDRIVLLDRTELPIRRGMVTELKKRLCSDMVL